MTTTFTYDANGSLTTQTVGGNPATFAYTPDRMVATISAGGATTTYGYDGDLLRTTKTGAGQTVYTIHDGAGRLLSTFTECPEQSGVVRWTRDELYLGGHLLGAVRAWQPDPGEDYDDDARSDFVVYRPQDSTWFILTSSTRYTTYSEYGWGGQAGDVPLPGDFHGDGTPDLGIYRPASATSFLLSSSSQYTQSESFVWGAAGDVPTPGDFDADGKTDAAVYRPATGEWFVKPSRGVTPWSVTFGQSGDVAVQPVVTPAAPAHPDQFVEYAHLDALGSIRAVTNAAGILLRRHDFLPFGEEWQPPVPSSDARLFTGKERDAETGLDYFGARYYAPTIGRYTTVDPLMTLADSTAEPQKWNRYAYVRNNPLRYVDPDGREEQKPSQQEIIKELDRLAGLYKVPKELVTAVARTESQLDVDAKNVNISQETGKVISTDYGLMQVNSTNINKQVTGEDGAPFTIPDAVKTDWKANANAGVAIVAQEYKAAEKDQPTGTAQTKAQQTYSGYNAGPDDRSRYKTTEAKGNPKNKKDQNFLTYYLQEVKRREAK